MVGSDENIWWHVTEMTILAMLNDVLYMHISLCLNVEIEYWIEYERQLLKMWKN